MNTGSSRVDAAWRGRLTVLCTVISAAVLGQAAAVSARAQEGANAYPSKPLRILVGFAAGGGTDLFARLIGHKLSKQIGQPVVIENKPGAGGRLAAEYAASQPADGYTLLLGASGTMAVASAIYPKLSYHPTRTFRPLTEIASFP
jgi:tripartite-type tricarboxylate transporter receptor subunit TctC